MRHIGRRSVGGNFLPVYPGIPAILRGLAGDAIGDRRNRSL